MMATGPRLLLLLLLSACAGGQRPAPRAPSPPTAPLVGTVERAQIERALPRWRAAVAEATPEPAAVQALGRVPPGAEVIVYLGTWCGDSRREVARLWRALDLLGKPAPFGLRLVGVDRAKRAPGLPPDLDLRYVPTFVVVRDGHEVGRVVETAPGGIEVDLGALLSGTRTGVLSEREDL